MQKKYSKEEALGIIMSGDAKSRVKYLFDYCPQPIAYISAEGDFLAVNQSLCRFLEYSDIELCNKTFTEVTHPEDIGVDWSNLRRLERGESNSDTYTMFKRYITKTGIVKPLFLTVFPVRDDSGSVIHYVSHIVPAEDSTLERVKQANIENGNKIKKSTKEATFDFIMDYYQQIIWVLIAIGGVAMFMTNLKQSVETNTKTQKEMLVNMEDLIRQLEKSKSQQNPKVAAPKK